MRIICQDDNKTMKSEVHKGHRHHRRQHHEHRHHHSKHRQRHEDSSKTCTNEMSPVPAVPSDASGSEGYFPLSKNLCGVSGSESPENSAARKRPHNDVMHPEEIQVLSSDSDDDLGRAEEKIKRRRKHKHKEKKKRKHQNKKQRVEEGGEHGSSHLPEVQRRRERDSDSEHSLVRLPEQQLTVKVKQEPLSSDEESTRHQRTNAQKQKTGGRDRNGHSNNDLSRDHSRLRLERRIKEELRDRSSSRERRPSPELLRHSHRDRKNGSSDNLKDRQHLRNDRLNGATSSAIKIERDDRSWSGERDRRQRNAEQEDRSRNRNNPRERPRRIKREQRSEDEKEYEWGRAEHRQPQGANAEAGPTAPAGDKKKPDFGLSGKLTEDVNVYNGVVIKYSEPPEARKPKRRWRFYPFKGDEALKTLYLHRQSAYLIGRDRKVADIPVDHPSCSKQHAALQYRLVPFTREDGTRGKRVRPYIIDLDSANGTYVNNKRIDPRKYVELMERDVVKFGYSSRDYVLLHEHSKGDEEEDDDDDQNG